VVRGVIDFVYRNEDGWQILAVDRGTTDEDDPWRGRRPGLMLQAWAVRQQLAAWPVFVHLSDLATGQLVTADPQRARLETIVDRLVAPLISWQHKEAT